MCLRRPVTSTELCDMHRGVSWPWPWPGDLGHMGCHGTCLPSPSILVVSAAWEPCLPSASAPALPGGGSSSGCQEAIHLPRGHHVLRAPLPLCQSQGTGWAGGVCEGWQWSPFPGCWCRRCMFSWTDSAHACPSPLPSPAQALLCRAKLQPRQQAAAAALEEGKAGNRQGQQDTKPGPDHPGRDLWLPLPFCELEGGSL